MTKAIRRLLDAIVRCRLFFRCCPQCGGTGKYATEVMARYGDKPAICGTCNGAGKIRRWHVSISRIMRRIMGPAKIPQKIKENVK